ncbi:MAG: flavin reductase, partial [Erysipelotrichaceae bacterium]|nr:flavin reductase [Erysipelotrichaceae bacterium]
INVPALINLDFADIETVMRDKGLAHIGIGEAVGDDRATEAVKMAVESPLLETTIDGASHVIINISGDISLYDTNDAASYVQDLAGDSASIIFGAKYDDSTPDAVTITVIATGLTAVDEVRPKAIPRPMGSLKMPTLNQPAAPSQPEATTPEPPAIEPIDPNFGKKAETIPAADLTSLVVDNDAFRYFTYGVEVLTTRNKGADYGCIINTALQVAAGDEKKVAVSVINKNYTREMIEQSGNFTVSVLTEDTPFSLFQHFGFQSGRDVDKFLDVDYNERMGNGTRYIPTYTNTAFSCEVIASFDLGASTLFIGKVIESKVLSKAPSATYGYYHAHIKPKKQPVAEQKEGWRCKVCGYFYEGKDLPADFVCPLCKHGPEDFEYVAPVSVAKKKGFICKVCGHFEPFEGDELPKDYVCPICKHGPEDFERAEQ